MLFSSGGASFDHGALYGHGATELIPEALIVCHDLSFVHNEEFLSERLQAQGLSLDAIQSWLSSIWRMWEKNPSLRNLHPLVPEWFAGTTWIAPEMLPVVLRGLARGEIHKGHLHPHQ